MIIFEKERSDNRGYIYHQNDTDLNFKLHMHNSFEFIFIYEGCLNLCIDKQSFELRGGQAALLLPNQVHSYSSESHSKSYLCVFSSNYLYTFYEKHKDLVSQNPIFDFDDYNGLVEELKSSKNEYAVKSIFYRILACYTKSSTFIKKDIKTNEILAKILTYIENNFKDEISLKGLAKEMGYDYNYLSNLVNKTLSTNFLNLVNEYRISHAQYLLTNTDHKITDIAQLCGYDSIRSFNRNFLALTASTPKEFKAAKNMDKA